MLAICVRLCSCLCIVCSQCFRRSHACHMCLILFLPMQSLLMHVFQKFSYLLCGLCLSLSSLTLPQTVRLFIISLCSQAPQQQYTVAFLFFNMKAWPQSQTDLFTCTTVLHCGHTLLTCIDLIYVYYTVGIPFSHA